jgi:hypothetical protein
LNLKIKDVLLNLLSEHFAIYHDPIQFEKLVYIFMRGLKENNKFELVYTVQ